MVANSLMFLVGTGYT